MNQMVVSHPVTNIPQELPVNRDPAEILEEAKKAAIVLKKMIADTHSSMKIGNSEHIKFEAWQTVGTFFNVTADTSDVSHVNINDCGGAMCIAKLIDSKTGLQVGGGTAYCMEDERNWGNKPWFQLASMAQTRAAAKAFANKFRWISVLAGYAPTPAEEMTEHDDSRPSHQGQSELMTFDLAALITGVNDMLGKMNEGDSEAMNTHLKMLTKYTSKDGVEKWLELKDLPGVGQHKPAWIKQIHKKVKDEYQKSFTEEDQKK